MNFAIEPFGQHHDRQGFNCGNEPLDRYFKERIRKDVEAGVAAAFVMADGPSVLGYYTLSSHNVKRESLPEEVIKKLKLPRYPFIPATLMGRLAVDLRYRGQRIGETLLVDGLRRSCVNAEQVASFAVMVDAKEDAVEFYRRYGFIQLPGSNQMFLPMKTVRDLFDMAIKGIS